MAKTNKLWTTLEERLAAGKALREKAPRGSHAQWKPAPGRPDPVRLIEKTDHGRVAELLPIRYGRMRQSPFAFYRGTAALMALDLSTTPKSSLRVQACGDCHVANFGGYGSPERRLVFDINDFDETLHAPWEWDVKRLAASIVLAGRELSCGDRQCDDSVLSAVSAYRVHMRDYAKMPALDAWYSQLDAKLLVENARSASSRKDWVRLEKDAYQQTSEHIFPRLTNMEHGVPRFTDRPPLVYHPREMARIGKHVREMFERYRRTLPEEKRVILDRYKIADIARKVVGVGSVGTRCDVALLMAGPTDPLLLQVKEARASVLEPYAGKSRYENHGERVVTGQRMLQTASDVFLGWTRDDDGHDYYFRQLRDMRMKIDIAAMSRREFFEYVEFCGWALARAHARTGDAAQIAGYLGTSSRFDQAIAKFAAAYAEQTERDYALFAKALRAKKLPARATTA
ncbi:MAG TPA: DUF2252 domain-containing protein [Candidatus Acidoferrum sp.]|jgi:uncharacterized protein (DUF2252 family)|nr:DUF2252 domain-containing protein [Candidatus Acidoferrum sp.]